MASPVHKTVPRIIHFYPGRFQAFQDYGGRRAVVGKRDHFFIRLSVYKMRYKRRFRALDPYPVGLAVSGDFNLPGACGTKHLIGQRRTPAVKNQDINIVFHDRDFKKTNTPCCCFSPGEVNPLRLRTKKTGVYLRIDTEPLSFPDLNPENSCSESINASGLKRGDIL
jgi:hypothetical protein